MRPTIREGRAHDIEAVLELWALAGSVPVLGDDSPDGLTKLLATDPRALLLAELDGLVVGSLIAAWDGWRGSFYRLAVAPEQRRRGLATALIRAGEQSLRERGAIRLTAIVDETEGGAMGFWRAAGYARQTHRARFVHHVGQ